MKVSEQTFNRCSEDPEGDKVCEADKEFVRGDA